MSNKIVEGIHIARREPPDSELRVGDVWYARIETKSGQVDTVTILELTNYTVLLGANYRYKISEIEWIERVSEGCDAVS